MSLIGYLLFYLVLALGITSAIAYGYRTLHSHPTFAIDSLEIERASSKTESDLRAQLEWVMHRNFFSVDLGKVQEIALNHPWVASANVHGHLPRRIKVIITERKPAGLVQLGKRVMVVGEDGQSIAPFEEMAATFSNQTEADEVLDLPVITGVARANDVQAAVRRGLNTLDSIKETSLLFWGHIETLDLSDERNMIVQLRNVHAPLYLGGEVIPANIRNYLTIAEHIKQEYPQLDYIELGFPNHIAIMPKDE